MENVLANCPVTALMNGTLSVEQMDIPMKTHAKLHVTMQRKPVRVSVHAINVHVQISIHHVVVVMV